MGGGSLKWGPPLVKRVWDYRFLPEIVNPLKWVCGSEWVCVFDKNDNKWVCVSSGYVVFYEIGLSVLTNLSFLKQ